MALDRTKHNQFKLIRNVKYLTTKHLQKNSNRSRTREVSKQKRLLQQLTLKCSLDSFFSRIFMGNHSLIFLMNDEFFYHFLGLKLWKLGFVTPTLDLISKAFYRSHITLIYKWYSWINGVFLFMLSLSRCCSNGKYLQITDQEIHTE